MGLLELQKESLAYKETALSHEGHEHPAHDFDWVRYRFTALFVCNNKKCMEVASVAGSGGLDEEHDWENQDISYTPYFFPEYFMPSPAIIPVPAGTPEEIKEELALSFSAYWGDPSAAANKVRLAVERLLDHRRITNFAVRNGRRRRKSLHERIEDFKAKQPDLAECLLAIKWLGNAGSHPEGLSREDMLDAYEILQHVLEELYVARRARAAALARGINRRKGAKKKR